jgi:cold shock CspA family protein
MSSSQGVGTVKWYNPEKAYGFITTEDGRDLFVHRNSIADGRPWLIDGQGVEFTLRQGEKGPEAGDVRVVQDVEEIPASRQRLYDSAGGRGGSSSGGDSYGGDTYGGGGGGGGRGPAPRRSREPYAGPVPSGPVLATVQRIDPSGRFLFVRSDSVGDDVYVHSSLFAGTGVREGDEVQITVEQSERGLRARSMTLA